MKFKKGRKEGRREWKIRVKIIDACIKGLGMRRRITKRYSEHSPGYKPWASKERELWRRWTP